MNLVCRCSFYYVEVAGVRVGSVQETPEHYWLATLEDGTKVGFGRPFLGKNTAAQAVVDAANMAR